MTILKEFDYEEHTADIIVNGYGNTPKRAIEAVTLGILNLIYDIDKVEKKEMKEIEIKCNDILEVIHDVAEKCLEEFYVNNFAIRDLDVINMRKLKNPENRKKYYWYVRFRIYGEKYEKEKHNFKKEVKAVTMHDIDIQRLKKAYWTTSVVVDL